MKTKWKLTSSDGRSAVIWASSLAQAHQSAVAEYLAGPGPIFNSVEAWQLNPQWETARDLPNGAFLTSESFKSI